jgi:YD repeat-containing protein
MFHAAASGFLTTRVSRTLALMSVGLAIMFACAAAGPAADPVLPADSISYAYDEVGRLTAVIDPKASSNGVARYHYDEVGNITSIERLPSSGVSVVQLSPARGAVGSSVTIYGTGFSATTSSNTVSFGGAGATVTQATKTQLQVTVPSGASTGSISVTSPTGSATSGTFTVVPAPTAPSITSVSSAVADFGATVTLTGSAFATTAADNTVAINRMRALVTSAAAASLSFTIPTGATSGRVLASFEQFGRQPSSLRPSRGSSSRRFLTRGPARRRHERLVGASSGVGASMTVGVRLVGADRPLYPRFVRSLEPAYERLPKRLSQRRMRARKAGVRAASLTRRSSSRIAASRLAICELCSHDSTMIPVGL